MKVSQMSLVMRKLRKKIHKKIIMMTKIVVRKMRILSVPIVIMCLYGATTQALLMRRAGFAITLRHVGHRRLPWENGVGSARIAAMIFVRNASRVRTMKILLIH
jgi:hypothetical protein